MNKTPTHVYYDLVLTNFSSTYTRSLPIEFREARNSPIIDKASDYMLSVVRFQIDSYGLPSYMGNIQPNQGDRDLMIESVTLEGVIGTNTFQFQEYLRWIPRNLSARIPNPPNQQPNGFQDLDTEYYYGNHFQYFCDLVNTALETAATALRASLATFAGLITPFLYWDSTAEKARLYVEENLCNPSNANYVRVYFNRPLDALFNSFKSISNTNTNVTFGRNYLLVTNTDEYKKKKYRTTQWRTIYLFRTRLVNNFKLDACNLSCFPIKHNTNRHKFTFCAINLF